VICALYFLLNHRCRRFQITLYADGRIRTCNL
jgi:hypothetical protein